MALVPRSQSEKNEINRFGRELQEAHLTESEFEILSQAREKGNICPVDIRAHFERILHPGSVAYFQGYVTNRLLQNGHLTWGQGWMYITPGAKDLIGRIKKPNFLN